MSLSQKVVKFVIQFAVLVGLLNLVGGLANLDFTMSSGWNWWIAITAILIWFVADWIGERLMGFISKKK